jgi:hypothetical protein
VAERRKQRNVAQVGCVSVTDFSLAMRLRAARIGRSCAASHISGNATANETIGPCKADVSPVANPC